MDNPNFSVKLKVYLTECTESYSIKMFVVVFYYFQPSFRQVMNSVTQKSNRQVIFLSHSLIGSRYIGYDVFYRTERVIVRRSNVW